MRFVEIPVSLVNTVEYYQLQESNFIFVMHSLGFKTDGQTMETASWCVCSDAEITTITSKLGK